MEFRANYSNQRTNRMETKDIRRCLYLLRDLRRPAKPALSFCLSSSVSQLGLLLAKAVHALNQISCCVVEYEN